MISVVFSYAAALLGLIVIGALPSTRTLARELHCRDHIAFYEEIGAHQGGPVLRDTRGEKHFIRGPGLFTLIPPARRDRSSGCKARADKADLSKIAGQRPVV